jgi:transglutaminase-like putative cysteine protease
MIPGTCQARLLAFIGYKAFVHFHIEHESLYRYDVPVQLGEHVLRLTPRVELVSILRRQVVIEPQPTSFNEEVDGFGNPVTRVGFAGYTQVLRVRSELDLDTRAPPAPALGLGPLPCFDTSRASDELGAYRGGVLHPSVQQFANELAAEAQRDPVRFLDHMTQTLYSRIDRGIRPSGAARAAHETLALGSGACRDLTVLFLEACRSQGLAARFVSGYQAQAQTPDGQRHLHAWAEVFLEGSGWHAWDPMHGIRVGDGHVALCAAPQQAATMPIEGGFSFQGATVNSTLDHSVRIGTL